MKKFPIGIQSFEEIQTQDYLYVDKTGFIQKLIETGKVYFLSRPRRFGKSLLISTMEAYFEGRSDLFHGLAIEDYENAQPVKQRWISFPVLRFSLSGGAYQTDQGLENKLRFTLNAFEDKYGIRHDSTLDLPTQFSWCLHEAYSITGLRTVVLVDEYDKPLLENMALNPEQEERNRIIFKSFFSILKDEDSYLRFVFMTGVTKFSKVSIFSNLNQLEDITMAQDYAGICGIIESELEMYCADNISAMTKENNQTEEECRQQLRTMYDGYHFSYNAEGVYNPFSLFNALKQKEFDSYWFETGTPVFLIRTLQSSSYSISDLSEGVQATGQQLSEYRADDPDPVPLFYQTGYLTIIGWDEQFRTYTLGFPNQEVRNGFMNLFPS